MPSSPSFLHDGPFGRRIAFFLVAWLAAMSAVSVRWLEQEIKGYVRKGKNVGRGWPLASASK